VLPLSGTIPGADLPRVFTVSNLHSARDIKDILAKSPVRWKKPWATGACSCTWFLDHFRVRWPFFHEIIIKEKQNRNRSMVILLVEIQLRAETKPGTFNSNN